MLWKVGERWQKIILEPYDDLKEQVIQWDKSLSIHYHQGDIQGTYSVLQKPFDKVCDMEQIVLSNGQFFRRADNPQRMPNNLQYLGMTLEQLQHDGTHYNVLNKPYFYKFNLQKLFEVNIEPCPTSISNFLSTNSMAKIAQPSISQMCSLVYFFHQDGLNIVLPKQMWSLMEQYVTNKIKSRNLTTIFEEYMLSGVCDENTVATSLAEWNINCICFYIKKDGSLRKSKVICTTSKPNTPWVILIKQDNVISILASTEGSAANLRYKITHTHDDFVKLILKINTDNLNRIENFFAEGTIDPVKKIIADLETESS